MIVVADVFSFFSSLSGFAEAILTISAAVALLWTPLKRLLTRFIDEQREIDEKQNKKLQEILQMLEPMGNGLQHMLRFRIERECKRINERGYIGDDEFVALYRLHESYNALGQNGLITTLYEQAINQPKIKGGTK